MINRRSILVGGGAGIGLVVAWGLWPRTYAPNLVANPGETPFGAWLKIGTDGHVTVAVPQVEHGQGVYTTLPQIVADELGADWRTIGVEPAPSTRSTPTQSARTTCSKACSTASQPARRSHRC
ncbi:molybdopterin cofactor-binding domain-containing protein [Sphingomonas sp. LR55]|uniref:molybdopterin cofactor-binding domain-containing protein n=1 Tax=Sphingomonas sp. LR55 TaxID=3050231 RepID=UPI002FE189DD